MDKQKFITRIALDDLLNDLGLGDMTEEFKSQMAEDILEKYHQLVTLKLNQLLGEEKFEQLIELEEDQQDIFLTEHQINLQEVMQFTADFLREHLEDYSQGVEEFLEDQTK